MSLRLPCLAALVLALAPSLASAYEGPTAAPGSDAARLALFPVQNRAGDSAAARALDTALRLHLQVVGRPIDPEATRDELRRLRVRNGDRAAPALLRLLGQSLDARWLVSAALHDAERGLVPRLTVSARAYSAETGELVWAGFAASSGIDRRGLLGLGGIQDLERLIPVVVEELLKDLPASPGEGTGTDAVAIVPFAGATERRATHNAETVTEAVRARLYRRGVPTLSPNSSYQILRQFQEGRFGGVTETTRTALVDGGARTIVTGTVEAYDVAGADFEPEPRVAVAMRVVDGASGRILWNGAVERKGFDGQGLFGSGRQHSRGALVAQVLETLTRRMEDDDVSLTGDAR